MKTGCLLLHGFTGGPFEVEPLARFLEEQGFQVGVPTLPGHTGDLASLKEVSYQDWLDCALLACQNLSLSCEKLVVIGFSMGGLLGIHLAQSLPVHGLVTISTPIYVWDFRQLAKVFVSGVKLGDFGQIKQYYTKASKTPVGAALQFKLLLRSAKPRLARVGIPVLVLQGLKDSVVKAKSAEYLYQNFASTDKQLHWLSKSQHVVCLGPESDKVNELVLGFVEGVQGKSEVC